jgi:6-phosphogluconolactonase (cycloisomerase 2 family)
VATAGSFSTTLAPASTIGSGDITSAELINRGLAYPTALAYTTKTYSCGAADAIFNDLIYVVDSVTPGLAVYAGAASGAATPLAKVTGTNTGLAGSNCVAVDASGRVYVANSTGNSVTMYAAGATGNAAPLATIGGAATLLSKPQGVALDSSGRIYVTSHVSGTATGSTVTMYAANPSGAMNEAPLTTLSGTNTGLNNPECLVLDSTSRLYVANYGATSVTIYAAGANGNQAPVTTISGTGTGLASPHGIALDASGKIYVVNYTTPSVTVYASGATGAATPSATIAGTATVLNTPYGVALDASGRIYVANLGNNTVTVYAAGANGNVAPTTTITGATGAWGIAIR